MALNDFHVSEPYTLGIELEMQVINPPGLRFKSGLFYADRRR
ncbi:carboxylate-amine ligase [Salmonella enterica subsp. enterica]|nr:carboxylate-amine ligase [Salmonella enterica subsp. enterica]